MKKLKFVLILSLIVNLLFFAGVALFVMQKGGIDYLLNKVQVTTSPLDPAEELAQNPIYQQNKSIFASIPETNGGVVFLGDSITADGEWKELFGDADIKNRGIPGDTTLGVLNRLDSVIESEPVSLFLMIGTNDIFYSDIESSIINYKDILVRLTTEIPETNIFIQSVIPVNNSLVSRSIEPSMIKDFNSEIAKLSGEFDVTYIDLFSLLADEEQELNEQYTFDGIHLNGKAYQIWAEEIQRYVNP